MASRIAKAVSFGVGIVAAGAAVVALERKRAKSLFLNLERRIDQDRSIYGQVPPYPVFMYCQMLVTTMQPSEVATELEPRLKTHGLRRCECYSYFEFVCWERGDARRVGRAISVIHAGALGMEGTLITDVRHVNALEGLYARLTQRTLSDDPLGQGTHRSFFNRSIPLD